MACAMHCVATPFLSLLPLVGIGFLTDERIEWGLLLASLSLSSLSLIPDYLHQHRRAKPIVLFAAGFVLLLIARLWFEEQLHLETSAIFLGAMLILTAYWINRSLCRTCQTCRID